MLPRFVMRSFSLLLLLYFISKVTGKARGENEKEETAPSMTKSRWLLKEWKDWWSYSGMAGPIHWGSSHQDWHMCKDGKQQSPININPDMLLYDPNLRRLSFNGPFIEGNLQNTRVDITLSLTNSAGNQINVTGGPLSYLYRITDIKFHFSKKGPGGSEHSINNKSFPAEMHIIGYNTDVYKEMDYAIKGVKGLISIAVFIEEREDSNYGLEMITKRLRNIKNNRDSVRISGLSLTELLPATDHYMTYEGSLTQPGCHESVTWIIYNKPIYISHQQMKIFRNELKMEWIHNNARPAMPLYQRVIRTNIDMKNKTNLCTVEQHFSYRINELFTS